MLDERFACLEAEQGHGVGALLGQAGTSDVVDAHLVLIAAERASTIWTADPKDLRRLADQLPVPVQVRRS